MTFKATLNDMGLDTPQSDVLFISAREWAIENCESFKGVKLIDVSDFSPTIDVVAEYEFDNEFDRSLFILRWK